MATISTSFGRTRKAMSAPALEPYGAQPRRDVVPADAVLREVPKPETCLLDPVEVALGDAQPGAFGDVVVEAQQVGLSARPERDPMRHVWRLSSAPHGGRAARQ